MVAKTRGAEVKAIVHRQFDKANSFDANTLIISAESFYAMTLFFHKFNGRRCGDYWSSESEAIEFLFRALPAGVTTRLIVFFRRQDYFLESLYRQVVQSRGVAMPIDEFGLFVSEALNYWRHMQIWSAVFPDCAVYTYEEASNNISDFFLRNVLHVTNTDKFEGLNLRSNIRLSRDLLEYKRRLNGTTMSDVDKYLSNLACIKLSRYFIDDGRYQDYLAPRTRVALLREMETNNALLSDAFGMKPFPMVSEASLKAWSPYPGLSAERARALAKQHARIMRSAAFRIERSALLARQFIQERLPTLAWIIPLGRSLLPQHRHVQ
jgi:hypothetical protein